MGARLLEMIHARMRGNILADMDVIYCRGNCILAAIQGISGLKPAVGVFPVRPKDGSIPLPPLPQSGPGQPPVQVPGVPPTNLPPVDKYYEPAQGKKGLELLNSLSGIVKTGPPTIYTYEQARDLMYGQLDDPTNTDTVTDVYTGRPYSEVSSIRSASAKGLTAEHVWPQSTGATDTAKTDLHHIITCDGIINSIRSNLPYGDVDKVQWASPPTPGLRELSTLGTDASGNRVFEPRPSMQGDVARMQLYFFTRYHGDKPKKYTLKNFKVSLPSLLKWAKEDPPDDLERQRNEAIYKLQGNRNPYVDHPEWVEAVGFNPDMLRKERLTKAEKARRAAEATAETSAQYGVAQAATGALMKPALAVQTAAAQAVAGAA